MPTSSLVEGCEPATSFIAPDESTRPREGMESVPMLSIPEAPDDAEISADLAAYPMGRGPCVKQTVTATIVATTGERFVGTNYCRNAQSVCPRADMPTGVGYELCKSICDQPSHAEVNAIAAADEKARGATLFLEGHTYACAPCTAACDAAGIISIVIGAPE